MSRESDIKRLLAIYQEKRLRAESKAQLRQEEVALKAPIYKDLSARLVRIMMDGALASDPAAAKKAVLLLRDEAREALRLAGYEQSYLEPQYECPLCNDTGYVGEVVKEYCTCFLKNLEGMRSRGLTSPIETHHIFEGFDEELIPERDKKGRPQREKLKKIKNALKDFAENMPQKDRHTVFMVGESGLGKTFLLDSMVSAAIKRGLPADKFTSYKMLDAFKAAHIEGEDEDLRRMLEITFLAIDDLGSEPIFENISIEYLYSVVNERQQRGLTTVVATNLMLGELKEKYTERIFSRLTSSYSLVLPFEGDDLRHIKKKA